MLFWLFVIILAVGIFTFGLSKWLDDNTCYDAYWFELVGIILVVFMVIAIIISGAVMLNAHCNADANVAKNKEIYKSLTYQLENNLYNNDNDLGKKELYKEIEEWNKDVVYYQNVQDNFWFGIYYPNVFDQFETIKYEVYE